MNDPKLDEAASQLKLFPTWLRMQYPATVGNIHCQQMEEQIDNILTSLSSLQEENEKLREDKELLDWLGTSKCHALTTFTEEEVANMSELMPIDINSFREAIRNAMKGTNE